ncbi:DUF6011 domain-containing protein [Streptomyces sp. NPDC005562]|uniref:DUF6011 domain-containing protein n=1 Tax=Streptomyces sp. NPDC005562 TaxID=3154890 RepID=UPI0033BDFF26
MAFQISGPLKLKGYDDHGKPDFGLTAPATEPAAAPAPARSARKQGAAAKTYPNKFGAACRLCKTWVPAQQGERLQVDGAWVTQHPQGKCMQAPKAPVEKPETTPAKNRPVCTPDGKEPLTGYFTAQFGADRRDYVTVRIRRQEASTSTFRPGELLVGYLMGSDNESDYTRFANIDDKGRCWIWKSYADNARLREAVASVLGDQKAAGEAWARESECCWRCGRVLTTPESLERLMGDECASKRAAG